jgi:hypothetical protein
MSRLATHPYKTLPDRAFWRKSVSRPHPDDVDPVSDFNLKITSDMRVATAGSCFAQHIARHLQGAGFNYYVAETGHPILPEDLRKKHGYGTFSARYANIYTARQLRQLIERATGQFTPEEPAWIDADGTVRDPFRPAIQPGNFISVAEMEADRRQHLATVREMLETLDVFVFTLGLTECWESRADGAVFPLCPGVEGGRFDEERYAFRNQTLDEVVADMQGALALLSELNPKAQVILTVSPVPLMATAAPDRHVLTATTYSKSVLRVAAETLRTNNEHVHYFPSYEVITGSYARGRYFAEDLRNVTEEGVSHVMRLFLQHATEGGQTMPTVNTPTKKNTDDFAATSQAFVDVECEEAALDRE